MKTHTGLSLVAALNPCSRATRTQLLHKPALEAVILDQYLVPGCRRVLGVVDAVVLRDLLARPYVPQGHAHDRVAHVCPYLRENVGM